MLWLHAVISALLCNSTASLPSTTAGARDGKKLRTDATLEQEYDLGGQLGEGGERSDSWGETVLLFCT